MSERAEVRQQRVRAAKTKALDSIRSISAKSRRPMKSTPSVKPKIIKKLSANEQELNAGKINTKTAVKKVLQDISNNTNVIMKPDSKNKLMKSVVSQQKVAKATNVQKKVGKVVTSTVVKATPTSSVMEPSTTYKPGPKSSKAIKFSPMVEAISKPGPKSSKKNKSIQATPILASKSSSALKFKASSNQLDTMIEESSDEEHAITTECNRFPGPKSSKAIKSTLINSVVFDSTGESLLATPSTSSLLATSSASLSSPSFVLAVESTPATKHANEVITIGESTLFYTDDESNSCIEVSTLGSPPAKKSKEMKNAYSFSMIEAGDSTDDETDLVEKPFKRPPPPEWSLTENRHETIVRQTAISARIIDKMFGDAPEVDLMEIFPDIEKKLLKRRDSSCIWHTPPRYSILPKY